MHQSLARCHTERWAQRQIDGLLLLRCDVQVKLAVRFTEDEY